MRMLNVPFSENLSLKKLIKQALDVIAHYVDEDITRLRNIMM